MPVQVLDFKTGINFGAGGNLREFNPTGFSAAPDAVSNWSEAGVAELTFRLPALRHDLRFVIEVFPYLADGKIPQQACWVFMNGLFVNYRSIRSPVSLSFTVPRQRLNADANRLSFVLPDAIAPRDLRLGNDLRLLGLSFVKLTVGPA